MRINRLGLENFKRFPELELEFKNDVTLIVGNNGSGKTTVLQAIVALIGAATQELTAPSDLDWPGFNYALLQSNGKFLMAEADCSFSKEELDATLRYYEIIKDIKKLDYPPSKSHSATLRLLYPENKVESSSRGKLYQFRGAAYARQLPDLAVSKSVFEDVGSIYWYSEQRSSSSSRLAEMTGDTDSLRSFLLSRYRFHQRIKYDNYQMKEDERNFYEDLATLYGKVFRGRTFLGSEPRKSTSRHASSIFQPDWFFLFDGKNKYEVSEMSAGERAIFPVLLDFANLRINNSIIIIDELELHLHPPLQQAFYYALPSLGRNNQFIVTTHSDYVASLEDEKNIIRL